MTESTAAPLVVMCAPNGARLQQSDHAAVPLRPAELADCAAALAAVGVSVLHLHVRDAAGRHTLDAGRYREAMDAIRERVGKGLLLQVTTESQGCYDRGQQMALLRDLRPEAASLAMRELCPEPAAETEAGAFFRELPDQGTWPQYILYSPQEAARFECLRQEGFFGMERPFALFVLGRYDDACAGSAEGLECFLQQAGAIGYPWAVCCMGPREGEAVRRAAELGGHVRIGFENNRLLPDGRMARDNTDLVEAELGLIARSAAAERPVASAAWVRQNREGLKWKTTGRT
jgi:uncharacterized protein (DUF849 family)